MKRFFSITGVLVFSAFLLSSFSLRENPQDPPRGKKTEKHIKMIKMDDEGNKIELDTILTNDDVFVWNGDTIGGNKEFKWISEDMNLDSTFENLTFDFHFSDDDGENVFFVNPRKNRMFVAPEIHGLPHSPADVMFFGNDDSNIVDLNDSGIISYKKKKMSGGREKITIIRNEPNEKNIKHVEKIIVDGKGDRSMFFGDSPQNQKIRIIKSDDGNVEIIRNGDVKNMDKNNETIKIIREDGKLIKIKEIKKGNEKEVEVEVELEEGGENN